ncbi:MAG: Ig-like domain-containing protein [Firmicutes bacterium]|nr:Ig-like domain-containing protein [Bacillota bacterium]
MKSNKKISDSHKPKYRKKYIFSGLSAVLVMLCLIASVCFTAGAASDEKIGNTSAVFETSVTSGSDLQHDNIVSQTDAEITVSEHKLEIGKFLSEQIETEREITAWESSDENIATVDDRGLVTGVNVGECTVSAIDIYGEAEVYNIEVKKVCYITVDDGPGPSTDAILAAFDRNNVKATFFVVYKPSYFYKVKDISDQGHVVAMHSYTHTYSSCYKSEYSYIRGLEMLSDEIEKYTGKTPDMVRMPGGSTNWNCKPLYERRIINGLHDMGYRLYDWTASTGDSSLSATYASSIKYAKESCTQDVEILLMHDKAFNVKALDGFIPYLRNKGYIFETLDKYPYECIFKFRYATTAPSQEVDITADSVSLYEGKTVALKAKTVPSNTTDFVRWESSDPSVATVNTDGTVTGVKRGTAEIYAIASSGVRDVCTVNVLIPAKKVTLNKELYCLYKDDEFKLTAELEPSNSEDPVTWKTSNNRIVTVDEYGNIKAKAKGKAVITAVTASGASSVCTVYVINPTKSIKIKNVKSELYTGDKLQLRSAISSGAYEYIEWTSSDESVATVSNSGKVEALSQGFVTITASTFSGQSDSVNIYVRTKAKSVQLDKSTVTMLQGETFTLNADILSPENCNDSLRWKVSHGFGIVTSEDGRSAEITLKKSGNLTVTVYTGSGKSATCRITSVKPTEGINIIWPPSTLYVGSRKTLYARRTTFGSNDPITWRSSDESIASITEKGKVTAISQGTVTLTAETFSGKSTSCDIVIRTKAKAISLDQTSITASCGEVINLNAVITSPENCNDTVNWTTSSKKRAVIRSSDSNSAEIEIVGKGYVVIKVKTGSGKYAQCKIKCV